MDAFLRRKSEKRKGFTRQTTFLRLDKHSKKSTFFVKNAALSMTLKAEFMKTAAALEVDFPLSRRYNKTIPHGNSFSEIQSLERSLPVMTFMNCFYTDMTASANYAEAPSSCAHFASNKAIALILDAVIAASILIALIAISLISITLVFGLPVLLPVVVLVRLVLVVLLVLEEVNRHRRRRTA